MNTQLHQGDVGLFRVKSVPKGAAEVPREQGKIILAHGEVTGHCHAVDVDASVARLFETSGVKERFLEVKEPCELTHQEHETLTLEPGVYQVRIHREFDWMEGVRRVAD